MTISASHDKANPADDLLLKVNPPRVPRHLLSRPRLKTSDERLRDQPIILVQAPAGFGKTSLLAQWRLEFLAHGSVVAWLTAQALDNPQRLVLALALAVRTGAGRPGFCQTLQASTASGLDGVTMWLAEVVHTALPVVLIVDEADRLPTISRDALVYLMRNAPPNLRVVVGARPDCPFNLEDLVIYGQCATVGAETMRFKLNETLELARNRLGTAFDADAAARMHELAEGWPLGVQLALSVIAGGADGQGQVSALVANGGSLREQFVGLLLANLEPSDVGFLTRISFLDHLHPDLCRFMLQAEDALARLARLVRDTPVFVAGEASEWLRMHTLARDVLRQRFMQLPAVEQSALHGRAADWLVEHGLIEVAARHALAADQEDRAYELAERSLYESLMSRGGQGTVLEWLARLPADELDRRPRLLLAAAWSLALSERHEEAEHPVARILAQPGVDGALRCECALILSGAAIFADNPDRFAELHDPWGQHPPLRDLMLLHVHANRSAFRALLDGDPALARLRQQQAPHQDLDTAQGYIGRWGDFIIGLSYLWEGQVLLTENLLRPTLNRAEAELGRRSPFATMLAVLLAAALWERDQPVESAALLSNRQDVLERSGLPETVLLGFRTLARIAAAAGDELRALELLGAMHAVGVARQLPRLRIASLTEQVRLHALRFRPETCRDLCASIDAEMAHPTCPSGPLWHRSVAVLRELAHGYAAIAAQDWRRALNHLVRADEMAVKLRQGRLHIELLGLRAFVLNRCGERSQALLGEAMDLAQAFGLLRVFTDAHPALGDWVRQTQSEAGRPGAAPGPLAAPIPAPQPLREAVQARATPSMALTPKEREVLELVARNLSNKEIGLAMQVGEETIKWHMKNLFAKLDAGTRRQVVARARILGLLDK